MDTNDSKKQLMVKFFTKNQKFAIADNPFSIPANSNEQTLNTLIKSILKEDLSDKTQIDGLDAIEFDFYINGNYLDRILDAFVELHQEIKTESVIEIEYVERSAQPEPIDTISTEDWVSAIKGNQNKILIGLYDNTVQLWNKKGEFLGTLPGHTGPVKAVEWISNEENNMQFVSCSHDQSILIWHWNSKSKSANKVEKCVGHSESVECVAYHSGKNMIITGSWDKTLKLWSLVDDSTDVSMNKKNKSDVNILVKTPIITLSGHSENVSSCKWMDENNVCTGSWDHSIRLWDTYTAQETRAMKSPSKIFLSIDYSQLNKLIIAGLNDSHLRVYDPRSNEGNLVKITMTSHQGWCSSVCWSTMNEHQVISGSYDKTCKLWDIRNPKSSVYDLIGHEDKLLCVDWSDSSLILTGSADNTFKMYST